MYINTIKILRSKKRKRTVSARLVKDMLIVRAPESIPESHLQKLVSEFKARIERKKLKEELNKDESLAQRAKEAVSQKKTAAPETALDDIDGKKVDVELFSPGAAAAVQGMKK